MGQACASQRNRDIWNGCCIFGRKIPRRRRSFRRYAKRRNGICFASGKRDAASDIGENQRGGAVKYKEQRQNRVCSEADGDGQFFPELREEIREYADPEYPGKSKAKCGPETDIAVIIKGIAAVIPVAQIPYGIEKPPDQKFESGADEQRKEERYDRVLFCGAGEQKVKKNAAHTVDGQPWTVEKAAVRKAAVFYKENGDFPEKAGDGAQKEKENLQRDKPGDMILFRWAEIGEIR